MGERKIFKATEVPLSDSNLIEASAGTGKTYSIAILLLRLLLEQRLAPKEVLMVTFTKAAVAELEERIRLFIRMADKAAQGNEVADHTVSELVRLAIAMHGVDQVTELLNRAVLLLDETSVMTIHSFCQQTLNEFAFETGQLFNCETLQDSGALLVDEVNKFWRAGVTTIQIDLLRVLKTYGLSRANFSKVLDGHFGGKRYIDYQEGDEYRFGQQEQEKAWEELREMIEEKDRSTEALYENVRNDEGNLQQITYANRYARPALLHLLDNPEAFIGEIKKKRGSGYIQQLYPHFLEACNEIDEITKSISNRSKKCISKLYCLNIGNATKNIAAYKHRNSVLSFDDMITNLHTATVVKKSESLKNALTKKYKAVFVDEFQDTDRLQYEIFHEVFGEQTTLFYIGDPKQSIYAWRKADINTYLKAAGAVKNNYGMNINYRSCASLIAAMNLFFLPDPDFDTFAFSEAENSFGYISVDAPDDKPISGLAKAGTSASPLTIFECANNDTILDVLCAQVLELLEDQNLLLEDKGERRRIRPSDIGILVRFNSQGKRVKNALSRVRVPAVTIDDTKILQSEEAKNLLYLLLAMNDPNRSAINKALLSPFTGYNREKLLQLDSDAQLDRFKDYGSIWQQSGIYVTMHTFLRDYRVRSVLLSDFQNNGERTLTNLMQLIEILHKVQSGKKLANTELINWLKKALEGMEVEGDEYQQRIESDEESVRILTIHKSKGLEYNIVFAPFLDLLSEDKFEFCSFRETDSGEYLFADKSQLNDNQLLLLKNQQEQENRRLIYVAITRAVYKCYLCKSTYYNNSSLNSFLAVLKDLKPNPAIIEFADSGGIAPFPHYTQLPIWKPVERKEVVNFTLADQYWHKISYTFLAKKGPYIYKENNNPNSDDYDHFVFKQLIRGSATGNLLHYIFENIDFTNDRSWPQVIGAGIKRLMPSLGEMHKAMILKLIDHVVNAQINFPDHQFSLSFINKSKRLSELEFDFNIGKFLSIQLDNFSDQRSIVLVNFEQQLEGMMNGKIDLFFELNGKYYILDWKSNFLGDDLQYYVPEKLQEVMNENNYNLQYLIYTLAAKKYLESRLLSFDYEGQFGGVIYMFLRGIRTDQTNGVFTCRPSIEIVAALEKILENNSSEALTV